MSLFAISCILTSFLALLLGLVVVFKGHNKKLNRIWFLVSVVTSIWSFGLWGVVTANSLEQALIFEHILNFGAIFIPVFYFWFVLTALKRSQEKKKILFVVFIFGLILGIISFFDLFIQGMRVDVYEFNYWINPGPLYFLFPLFYLFVVSYSVYLLLDSYREATGVAKNQIKYILISGAVGYVGASTNFFPQIINIYPLGNYFVILYVIIMSYAIVKHRLMDIKVVMRKYSVYIASLISIILPSVIIKIVVDRYHEASSYWVDFVILIAAISVFPSIKNKYYYIANKYFFSSLYDAREVLASFSEKLRTTIDPRKIFLYISETILNSLHSKSIAIYAYNEKTKAYEVRFKKGFKSGGRNVFKGQEDFIKNLVDSNPILVEELKEREYVRYRRMIDMLERYKIEVIIPLNIKENTIGLVVLGAKESKDLYNEEDLQVLEIIGAQAAISLENALLFEETKNFSIKMKKEVEQATADLRAANIQLKELDQAKSDFVSIASHQLRTPLTVIKGYISMMLEGNFGKVDNLKLSTLEKVFESNERLIRLVENLLNISRIESGRLQFNFETLRLEDLVKSVIEELSGAAQRKGLKLEFRENKDKLPPVRIDEEKIRQVIMNLVDNAIKYSRQGAITITIKKIDKYLECRVKDTGIGVRQSEQANLFKKFSRGNGMFLINTEGTGLGLYVARQMVEAHNGKIWVESEGKNRGSSFCFKIPFEKFDNK